MRFVMVSLLAGGILRAQAPLSGEEALKKFKQKLDALTRGVRVAESKICAIPLLRVPAATQPVDAGMIIVPKGRFHIVQVNPPAPPCGEGNVSLNKRIIE
jgi:hypothetical protein